MNISPFRKMKISAPIPNTVVARNSQTGQTNLNTNTWATRNPMSQKSNDLKKEMEKAQDAYHMAPKDQKKEAKKNFEAARFQYEYHRADNSKAILKEADQREKLGKAIRAHDAHPDTVKRPASPAPSQVAGPARMATPRPHASESTPENSLLAASARHELTYGDFPPGVEPSRTKPRPQPEVHHPHADQRASQHFTNKYNALMKAEDDAYHAYQMAPKGDAKKAARKEYDHARREALVYKQRNAPGLSREADYRQIVGREQRAQTGMTQTAPTQSADAGGRRTVGFRPEGNQVREFHGDSPTFHVSDTDRRQAMQLDAMERGEVPRINYDTRPGGSSRSQVNPLPGSSGGAASIDKGKAVA